MRGRTVALAVAALLAGGCSLGDDDETAATTTTVTTTATPATPSVDLGVPETVEAVQPSVVTIFVDGTRGQGSGSGVI